MEMVTRKIFGHLAHFKWNDPTDNCRATLQSHTISTVVWEWNLKQGLEFAAKNQVRWNCIGMPHPYGVLEIVSVVFIIIIINSIYM